MEIEMNVNVTKLIILFVILLGVLCLFIPGEMKIEKIDLSKRFDNEYLRQSQFIIYNYKLKNEILDSVAINAICERMKNKDYQLGYFEVKFYEKSWITSKWYLEDWPTTFFFSWKNDLLGLYVYNSDEPETISCSLGRNGKLPDKYNLRVECNSSSK